MLPNSNNGLLNTTIILQKYFSNTMDIETYHQENNSKNVSSNSRTKNIKLFFQSFGRTAILFGKHTTFHGFNHMIEDIEKLKDSNINKKQQILRSISLIIWIISCVLGGVFTVYMMLLVWVSFLTTPTITTVETNNYPISNVQFPAVTLCSLNKIYAPATKTLTDKLLKHGFTMGNITEFYQKLPRLLSAEYIRNPVLLSIDQYVFHDLHYTVDSLMLELMQPCHSMVSGCVWLGSFVHCRTLFRIVKSSEGFCCAFNARSLRDSLEVNADNPEVKRQLNTSVFKVSGFGESVSLQVFLHSEIEHYLGYLHSYYGITVLINEPEDFPETSVSTVLVQPSFDVTVAVIPSIIVSTPSIRQLALSQRNCLFDDEKTLRTTDTYGFQSCISECVVDEVANRCNCTPFYYPHIHLKGRHISQCSLKDLQCLRKNRHIFSSIQPHDFVMSFNGTKLEGMTCSCYPSCSEQSYDVETSHVRRYINGLEPLPYKFRENLTATQTNYTSLKVFFKDIACIKYRRDMLMTWDELFATFGNVLCLCVGGSVISIIEMIYYFTFRLYSEIMHPHPGTANGNQSIPSIDEESDDNDNIDDDNNYNKRNEVLLQRMIIKSNNNNSIIMFSNRNMTEYGYFN